MLPILPVLLLLLFSGPANAERMAVEGRLPAAIEMIQRLENPPSDQSFASLLAASKDPEFTRAIFTLLKWVAPKEPAKVKPVIDPEAFVATPPTDSPPISEGYRSCQRSRDGPF